MAALSTSIYMKKILLFITIIYFMAISIVLAGKSHITIKEGFVNVPGGKIWYKIFSSEKMKSHTPLLILHGGPGIPHDYLEVLSGLATERPVIFYDQLGCGHSKIIYADKKLWNLSRYVIELNILTEHLKISKFHLLGHSWGGGLALEYTLKHPDKVVSLTLASPLLSTKLWVADSMRLIRLLPSDTQRIILTNEQKGTTESIEYKKAMDVFYQNFVLRMKKTPKKLQYSSDHINFDIYKTMWGTSEVTVTGNLKNFDRMNDLKKLSMPVLITGGKFDEATPHTLKMAVKQLPVGKLIIYEKSAHFAFLNEIKKYLNDLRLFLNSTDQQ